MAKAMGFSGRWVEARDAATATRQGLCFAGTFPESEVTANGLFASLP